MKWADKHGVAILHIQPGQSQQNAYIERSNRVRHLARINHAFNGSLRPEWRDQYIIETIDEAKDNATQRLCTYNNDRPNFPFTVCRQTFAGQWGIGGITPAQSLKMAA